MREEIRRDSCGCVAVAEVVVLEVVEVVAVAENETQTVVEMRC